MPWRSKKRETLRRALRMPRSASAAHDPCKEMPGCASKKIDRTKLRSYVSAHRCPSAWARRGPPGRTARTSGWRSPDRLRSVRRLGAGTALMARTARRRRSADRVEDIGALPRRTARHPASRFTPLGERSTLCGGASISAALDRTAAGRFGDRTGHAFGRTARTSFVDLPQGYASAAGSPDTRA